MAGKLTAKKRKEDLNKLFAEYNRRLGMLYSGYVKKLLALGYTEDVLESDALFNFDNFPVLKARLNEIFNDYFQNSMLCYKSGITSGVSFAYSHDNDALGQFSVLTEKALETARKTAAATFIANRLNAKNGLNLAQSVWNYCQQTKSEFEMAMSNVIADGLEKGTSAEEVGRRIRQYLNNPDMMYRRYHTVKVLKNGQKKDVVTWRRKRIINGRVRFVEEPLEHVGQGVYRSARKNALRVARTEINAAYHKARNGRWANEPFVIGQHIHISPQHDPDEDADICDELEGYYPKDFDWDGWHPQCYAEGTQVLTTKGWKEFKDVTTQDIVYSLNPQTREIEETSIVGVQKYPYNGELIHFFNRSLECLVTPEHQMVYISKSGAHEIKKCNATEYKPSMGAFYRSAVNTAKDRTNIMFGDKNIPFDVYCEFMGYYLADGSMQHDYGIVLSQEKGQPAWKRMQTCIKKMGFTPHVYKSTIVLYHRAFGQELLKYGTARYKYIPQEILNASKRQIQIFLDAFIVCDGHIKKPRPFMGNRGRVCTPNHGERMYFTSSPQMAAEIGLLLLKVGHRPSYRIMSPKNTVKKDGTVIKQRYDCYRISECDSATATVFNKEKVEYIGFVYDVTLENNHIMYIQKDGKCFWGSNCMCTSDPVMISGEERKQFYKRMLNGEDMSDYVSPNSIKDVPDQYKIYIEANGDKIVDAFKRGKLAWHLANNKSYWLKYLDAAQRKQMGVKTISRHEAIQEIAKARHAKRDAAKIQQNWKKRRMTIYTERMNNNLKGIQLEGALLDRYYEVVKALASPKTWDVANVESLYKRFVQEVNTHNVRTTRMAFEAYYKEHKKNIKQSSVLTNLCKRLKKAADPNEVVSLYAELRHKSLVYTRYQLRQTGLVKGLAFDGDVNDYVVSKARSYTTPKGKIVNIRDYISDFVKYTDKNGITYYYEVFTDALNANFNASRASRFLETCPSFIQNNLKGIMNCNNSHPLDDYFKKAYKNFSGGYMYASDPVTVHSYQGWTYFKESICHEVGHHIDKKLQNVSSMTKWLQAQKADGNYYRAYSQQAPCEDFADTVSQYVINKEKCRKQFPHRTALLEKLLATLSN